MAYLDYPGLSYFKSLLDETYLRTSYTGDTTIAGDVAFTGDTVFSNDITGNVDGKVKKDWKGQQIDSTYIKDISTNNNAGQIVYTKGDGTSNYIMIDMMQGATASAVGKAGLVPAPTISERTKFLRGDGEWGVPTDVYVTQNLINTNDSFPILIGATAGAVQSQVGTAIAFGTRVSVNPNTHTLIADHLILKHPTYRRSNSVSSKIMYTLNFADSDDGNGNNLSEIYGYIDPAANGGEHELGFRLFGNPNVQGVEEIFTYLSVGLSKTNVPYGHAPSTPLPADHNEGTDIITRDWLARNGSETGLVHTSMDETIDGIKTFTSETKNTSTAGITTTKLTASGKITGTGTAEISGGSGNIPSLKVTGNETVTGNSNVSGNSSVTGNETVGGTLTSTGKFIANGTAEIKGGSGSTPSLLVTGNETVTGKLTGTGTAEFSGGSENTPTLTVNGNESVSGNSSVGGNSSITGNETVGGNISTTNGNISTTNGTVSGKTGSIGTGGLTVAGTTTSTGKITGNGGAEINGGNGLIVNGDETVSGEIYKVVNNTTKEYVSYVTNKTETKNIIVNNLIKENGGLAQDSNHNIYVEIVDGGGIKYHAATAEEPYNGLVVDFSGTSEIAQNVADQMKADLLSSLGLQVPLTADKNVYVNPLHPNSSDVWHKLDANNHETAAIDTSAGSTSKPFKTIATAIQFATEGFSLGNKSINIRIQAYAPTANITAYNNLTSDEKEALGYSINNNHEISYYESLTLPTYNVTSGIIRFYSFGNTINSTSSYTVAWSKDANDTKFYKAIIDTKDSTSRTCMNIQGKYTLCGLHLRNNINYRFSTVTSQFPGTLSVNSGGIAYVYGCTIESKYLYGREHANSAEGNSVAYVDLRPVSANEGSIYFRAWDEGIPNEFHYDRGPDTYPNPDTADTEHPTVSSKVNLTGIIIWANSLVDFPSSNTDSPALYMIAEGSCTNFISCSGTGRATGGGLYNQSFRRWEGVDTALQYNLPDDAINNATSYHLMHGQKYSVVSGGILSSPRGGFPGDSRGSVNTETYSVYTGSTNDYNWNSSSLDTVIGD